MKDGYCVSCPNKCKWNEHTNLPYQWVFNDVSETKTYADVKSKYEAACQKKMSTEGVLSCLQRELDGVKNELKKDVEDIAARLKRLDEIALRSNAFTAADYIQCMISAEMTEKKPGFNERITSLRSLLQGATLVEKIRTGQSVV